MTKGAEPVIADRETILNLASGLPETLIHYFYNAGGQLKWNPPGNIHLLGVVAHGAGQQNLTTNPAYTAASIAAATMQLEDVIWAQIFGGWQQVFCPMNVAIRVDQPIYHNTGGGLGCLVYFHIDNA